MTAVTYRRVRTAVPPARAARIAAASFVAINLVIVEILFATAGPPAHNELTAIGRFLGLHLAFVLILQLLLIARLPYLDRRIGLDRLTVWHRWTGFTAFCLVLAHPVFVLLGYAQDVVGGLTVQAGGQDRCEPAGGGRLGGSAEEKPDLVAVRGVDVQEQRRLALGHRLHCRLREFCGQLRQLVGELQQQLELVLAVHVTELGDHLGQRCRHAHAAPGSSPTAMGTRTVLPHSVHEPS